jgi:glycine amidinotransferase
LGGTPTGGTIKDQLMTPAAHTEWDPLEEVIVGTLDNFVELGAEPLVQKSMTVAEWSEFLPTASKPLSKDAVSKANAELQGFVDYLIRDGVKVHRPNALNHFEQYKTPFFESHGHGQVCPRDTVLVVGDQLIEVPMSMRCRYFESLAYHDILKDAFGRGMRWVQAPKPTMADPLYDFDFPDVESELRMPLAKQGKFPTTNFEPIFDAADIMRLGKDLIMQKSIVTNDGGVEWLKRHLGPDYRVHVLNFDDKVPWHIDATLLPLRPGLALMNPERRPPSEQCSFFEANSWTLAEPPKSVHYGSGNTMITSWCNVMNMLSLDDKRIFVEADEKPLIKFLESLGMKPIPLPFRNVFPFGGSFHCVTCDIARRGSCMSYFPSLD